nr:Cas9 inhibitor AcrIIA9 family protein [uncultured Schaedlerella sp.]
MYEKVIHNTEELNAMAVHLRMAQNFPELRLLAAERLVPEQDVEDFISGKRFLLAEIPMSEKNYASAAEKLREEMWHLKDQLFTDLVAQYLIGRAKEDILFGFRVLKKHKSLQKCMDYIMKQAYQMAEKEREKKIGKKQDQKSRTGNQNQAFGLGIAETKVYQWAEEYYALEDEVKEAKEQAKERKKRLNALKRKEDRGKNAESDKKAVSDASQKTKEPTEQVAGKNQAAEQKQTAEQKEIPDTLAKEEEHAGEPEADLEGRQITVFDLLSGADAASKGGKE